MKSFVLIQHGPEIRYLSALSEKLSSDEIILLSDQRLASEVTLIVDGKWTVQTFATPPPSRKHRFAAYLFALCDSLARRVNRKRGISSFSYSRKVQRHRVFPMHTTESMPKRWDLLWLNIIVGILAWVGRNFYAEKPFVTFLQQSGCRAILIFDHLGGSDYIASNARAAGLRVEYYLNNHKDLSIRPYVPPAGSILKCWFDCQLSNTLNICRSHKKLQSIGLMRLKPLMEKYEADQIKQSRDCQILHFCADPRRRPYEVVSLKKIFDFVEAKQLRLQFILRKNPMDSFQAIEQLAAYPFVTLVEPGWVWDEQKFINLPAPEAELQLASQLANCSIVSALPSTTLVEGYLFGKQLVCLLDVDSPDRECEDIEMKLCLPETVRKSALFHAAHSAQDYVDVVRAIHE